MRETDFYSTTSKYSSMSLLSDEAMK